jgi:hypothetical protein
MLWNELLLKDYYRCWNYYFCLIIIIIIIIIIILTARIGKTILIRK